MRDLLLQKKPKDYDIVTTATPHPGVSFLRLSCRDTCSPLEDQSCQPLLYPRAAHSHSGV